MLRFGCCVMEAWLIPLPGTPPVDHDWLLRGLSLRRSIQSYCAFLPCRCWSGCGAWRRRAVVRCSRSMLLWDQARPVSAGWWPNWQLPRSCVWRSPPSMISICPGRSAPPRCGVIPSACPGCRPAVTIPICSVRCWIAGERAEPCSCPVSTRRCVLAKGTVATGSRWRLMRCCWRAGWWGADRWAPRWPDCWLS